MLDRIPEYEDPMAGPRAMVTAAILGVVEVLAVIVAVELYTRMR